MLRSFFFFKQILVSAVKKALSDSDVRQVLIETLIEENANTECKEGLTPSKAWKAHVDEWIRDTTRIGSNLYHVHSIDKSIPRSL